MMPFASRHLQGILFSRTMKISAGIKNKKLFGGGKIMDEKYFKQGITNSSIIFNAIKKASYQD